MDIKRIIRTIIFSASGVLIFYLPIAFTLWEPNPALWSESARSFLAVMGTILMIVAALIANNDKLGNV